ncbi:MAG: hypothetical protein AVDCRST_MAG93-8664, partial [uncultured Chloroflexia bacterium]
WARGPTMKRSLISTTQMGGCSFRKKRVRRSTLVTRGMQSAA